MFAGKARERQAAAAALGGPWAWALGGRGRADLGGRGLLIPAMSDNLDRAGVQGARAGVVLTVGSDPGALGGTGEGRAGDGLLRGRAKGRSLAGHQRPVDKRFA